jgi:ketosteroid isomerase-like protein
MPSTSGTVVWPIYEYCRAVDAEDWERLRACFAESCQATYHGRNPLQGVTQIVQFIRSTRGDTLASSHVIGNLDVSEEQDKATASAYCMTHIYLSGGYVRHSDARFEYELTRCADGAWRICGLRHRTNFAV